MTRLILTLTPNPSHDRTVTLPDALRPGAVQRASAVLSQAGGKGVNISRASVSAGVPTIAVLPAPKDDAFVHELLAAGIDCRPVEQAGDLRVNLTITDPDGVTTKLNSPGPEMTAKTRDALVEAMRWYARDARWAVLAGSLPPGVADSWYADLVLALADTGVKIAVDTSDGPLRALVDGLDRAAPQLMKPNGHELASLTGADGDELEKDPRASYAAARELLDRGVEQVLVTLGGNGAVLASAEGGWHAQPPPTEVVSTVGAGDCSLFGFLLGDAREQSAPERLGLAVAYGSAAAALPGTTIPRPDDVDASRVVITPIQPS